jgi:Tfp pilus assembly protein PilF
MSLLLDALKKAEAEKRRRSSAFGSREEQTYSSPSPTPPPARTTADKVELVLEDLKAPSGPAEPPEAPATPAAGTSATARASAEKLFTAKESPPATRRNLVLIVAGVALLLAAAGGGYYVWKETSQPSLATTPPGPIAAAPVALPPTVPSPAVARPDPVMVIEPRGSQGQAATAGPPVSDDIVRPSPAPPAPSTEDARPGQPTIRISRGQSDASLNPSIAAGYESLRQGDLRAAEANYRAALQADPRSRDALLGLAAVAAQAGQRESAERYYRAALAVNPRDPLAVAGLLGVMGADASSSAESRLKTLLTDQPDAAYLHYALGNYYASQQRWGEAQQAYFQALRFDPASPDFAFNLAVSLDQLAQNRLAAEYYRKALTLAESNPAAFDRSAAASRLRELGQ